MKEEHFNGDVAIAVGVNAAILYQEILYWTTRNKVQQKHCHNGRYWMYNSVRAWQEQLPFLSAKQIRLALKKLEDNKIIITGNFNKKRYDRTKWYTINKFPKHFKKLTPKGANPYQI